MEGHLYRKSAHIRRIGYYRLASIRHIVTITLQKIHLPEDIVIAISFTVVDNVRGVYEATIIPSKNAGDCTAAGTSLPHVNRTVGQIGHKGMNGTLRRFIQVRAAFRYGIAALRTGINNRRGQSFVYSHPTYTSVSRQKQIPIKAPTIVPASRQTKAVAAGSPENKAKATLK
jgi:hypothetical protein